MCIKKKKKQNYWEWHRELLDAFSVGELKSKDLWLFNFFRGRKKKIAMGRSNLQPGLKLSKFYALFNIEILWL